MEIYWEVDNQADTTDAKEVDKRSLLVFVKLRFLYSVFLMPKVKTCQGNNFLLFDNAIFVSSEACLVFTNNS